MDVVSERISVDDDRARSPGEGPREDGEQLPEEAAAGQDAVDWSSWSNLWQVPAIGVSLVVIATALYVATRRAPENDFQGAFDRLDQLIANEQFDVAAVQLNEVIEPNLSKATNLE